MTEETFNTFMLRNRFAREYNSREPGRKGETTTTKRRRTEETFTTFMLRNSFAREYISSEPGRGGKQRFGAKMNVDWIEANKRNEMNPN